MTDLTPIQFLAIRDCMKANPDANDAWIAARMGLTKADIEAARRMMNK